MMMKLSFFQQALVSSSRVFHLMDEKDLAPVQKEMQNRKYLTEKFNLKMLHFHTMENVMF